MKEKLLNQDSNISFPAIIEEIDHYFLENEMEMRNEVSILSDYYKLSNGEYEAHLVAKDKDVNLVEIKITVPFEDGAVAICEQWEKKNQDIYKYLMEQLF